MRDMSDSVPDAFDRLAISIETVRGHRCIARTDGDCVMNRMLRYPAHTLPSSARSRTAPSTKSTTSLNPVLSASKNSSIESPGATQPLFW